MFGLGMGEIVIILIVALLFLGPEKLPQAAKSIGKGLRELRRHTRDLQETVESDEHLGGTIRDLRSALRGDEPPPPPRRRPKLEEALAATRAASAGAATTSADQAPNPPSDAAPATTPAAAAESADEPVLDEATRHRHMWGDGPPDEGPPAPELEGRVARGAAEPPAASLAAPAGEGTKP